LTVTIGINNFWLRFGQSNLSDHIKFPQNLWTILTRTALTRSGVGSGGSAVRQRSLATLRAPFGFAHRRSPAPEALFCYHAIETIAHYQENK
jgi:hypothetical protein